MTEKEVNNLVILNYHKDIALDLVDVSNKFASLHQEIWKFSGIRHLNKIKCRSKSTTRLKNSLSNWEDFIHLTIE